MSTGLKTPHAFIKVPWRGREVSIEHQWLNAHKKQAPLFIFLHEGLGSLAMWRDFPQLLCDALDVRGLIYSRPGYGRSTPREANEVWSRDFMHQQALEVLPSFIRSLGIDQAPWLLGHSDGGSIALLFAAHHATAGAVLMAPHIKVEEICITSIQRAKTAYENTDLRDKLSRYHADVDSAFWGWNRIWLDPHFRQWSIEREISQITCPILAVQGVDDEYGTLAQIRDIQLHAPQTQLLELESCAHSPHRDQPQALTNACADFFKRHHQIHNN